MGDPLREAVPTREIEKARAAIDAFAIEFARYIHAGAAVAGDPVPWENAKHKARALVALLDKQPAGDGCPVCGEHIPHRCTGKRPDDKQPEPHKWAKELQVLRGAATKYPRNSAERCILRDLAFALEAGTVDTDKQPEPDCTCESHRGVIFTNDLILCQQCGKPLRPTVKESSPLSQGERNTIRDFLRWANMGMAFTPGQLNRGLEWVNRLRAIAEGPGE